MSRFTTNLLTFVSAALIGWALADLAICCIKAIKQPANNCHCAEVTK